MPHILSFVKPQPIDELTGGFNALNETTNVSPTQGDEIGIVHPDFRSGLISYREDGANRANPTPHPGISPDSMLPIDELTGTFKALNETTNFKPTQREEIGIIHPSYMPTQGDEIGVVHPDFKPDPRGYDPGPVGSLSETFGEGDPKMLGPISGEGPFKPQGIDAKGSVIVGDNHFKAGGVGDSLTGEVRLTKIWTNGGASTFQDRLDVGPVNKTACKGWWTVDGADFRDSEFDARNNDFRAVDIWTTGGTASVKNKVVNNLEGQAFLREQFSYEFACEFEPADGMNSFGGSANPVAELGSTAGTGATSFLTGQFEMPTDNVGNPYSAPID